MDIIKNGFLNGEDLDLTPTSDKPVIHEANALASLIISVNAPTFAKPKDSATIKEPSTNLAPIVAVDKQRSHF